MADHHFGNFQKFSSSPIDELKKGALGGLWSRDTNTKQGMQVSTVTPRAGINGNPESSNHQTLTTSIYVQSKSKGKEMREQKHSKDTNGTEKQTECSQTLGKQNT